MSCSSEDAIRLIEHCRLLVSSLDVDEVMSRSVRSAAELLGVPAARLVTVGETGRELLVKRLLDGGRVSAGRLAPLPAGDGLTAAAAWQGQSSLCADAGHDARFNPATDAFGPAPGGALLSVPLPVGGRPGGCLQLAAAAERAFTPEHLELLERFAGIAGAAIGNARVHRQALRSEGARQQLQIAAEIQRGLFPTTMPDTGPFEFDAVCIPAQEVGGDLYDLIPFPDGRFCVVLGDVSGKGVPAAIFMTLTIAGLRSLAERATDLETLMTELNRRLCDRATRGMFVTLTAGLLSPDTGAIEVASAGHHPPLLRRREGSVEEIPHPCAPPLGISRDFAFPTACFSLRPGEAVLGFTDGVIEARNPAGQQFGLARLKLALTERPGSGTLPRIVQTLARFRESCPLRDDTTMVLIRRTGTDDGKA